MQMAIRSRQIAEQAKRENTQLMEEKRRRQEEERQRVQQQERKEMQSEVCSCQLVDAYTTNRACSWHACAA